MSVERSSAPASPKATTGADGTGAKGKVKSGSEADAAASGGFAAILTALEPQAEVSPDTAAPLVAQVPLPPDASVLPDTGLISALPPVLPVEWVPPAVQAIDAGLTGEPAQAGLKGLTGEVGVDAMAAGVSGGLASVRHVALSADKVDLSNEKLRPLGADKAGDLQQSVHALLDQMSQSLPGMTPKARGLDMKSAAATSLAESKVLHQATLTEVMTLEPALSSTLLASGLGDGSLRLADRIGAKSSIPSGGSGLEGSWGQTSFQSTSNTDAPSVLIDPSAPSFETTLADTVSYWVKQGVQNAELKLDGLDGESIAVSIALNGDEANIEFRTDKPETRQALEGAVAHLKDLFSSEGLVLSGVSVGASGQDKAGAQEQGNQPGVRQFAFASAEKAPTERLPRVTPSSGRALDLYV
jgi:flagellar hook-length control protein FliK